MKLQFRVLAFAIALATPPASSADDAEIHTYHCLHGCPAGASATNDLIVRQIYPLSSNDLTKFSDWVAYKVTRATIGTGEDRRWQRDPWLGGDETLPPAAYEGASAALIFEQETPRDAEYCTMRRSLDEVEDRTRLKLFPRLAQRSFASLDAELGCPS